MHIYLIRSTSPIPIHPNLSSYPIPPTEELHHKLTQALYNNQTNDSNKKKKKKKKKKRVPKYKKYTKERGR
ncbi:uncharacterized protein EAE97_008637 [Botrytis byssoidea]|uniref:Uncharacterized protein n=1 Tax=Botrytis byssoidea TaxID=139641 RepID=A0A9P5ICB5_9HELO|nr:uncharacterized protein EAE97_008637 [Botrytis byssoidea]KAF7934277.1 hypothetical protein EAE97_008637 [Botrytis byssoidea]